MTDIKDIVSQVKALPPLPDTALRLINVINDPQSTVDEIVEAVKYDQAITGEVLRLCNSAHFGLSRRVTSLNEAMVFLGTAKVLQLVMAVHTNSLLGKSQSGYGLEPGILWRHSVAVALASSAFARHLKVADAGPVFTAGLLHDIGKVVLNEYVAEAFAEIVKRVTNDRVSFTEAEHQVLGFSHEEVGALVAETWKLPDSIVRCIRNHHDPCQVDPPDDLVDVVYLADCICLLMGIGLGEDGLSYRADSVIMERHNLKVQDLEVLGVETMTELKQVEQLFADTAGANRQKTAVSG